MRASSEDLTRGGRVCLTKALLEGLSRFSPGNDAYKLYLGYFERFVLFDENVNLSCWRRTKCMEENLRSASFKCNDLKAEPDFLTFWSQQDVERLSQLVGRTLVIYLAREENKWEIFHDFRMLADEASEPPFFLALKLETKRKDPSLFVLRDCHDDKLKTPPFASEVSASPISGSLLEKIRKLLAEKNLLLEGGGDTENVEQQLPEIENGPLVLAERAGEISKQWKLAKSVLLVSNTRCLKKRTFKSLNSASLRPSNCYFSILARFDRWGASCSDEDEEIVLCWLPGLESWTILREEFADKLRDSACTDKPANRFDCSAEVLKKHRPRSPRPSKKQGKKEKKKTVEKMRTCRCKVCSEVAYDKNMRKSGPEKLFKTRLSLSQLLKALGELNAESETILEELCELSVASMDIESRTVTLDLKPPNNEALISEPCPAHVKKIQKPVMIAHRDTLSGVLNFQAEDDSEEAVYSMMSLYWESVLELQLESSRVKRKIAEPIYKMLARYERALFELAENFQLTSADPDNPFLAESNAPKFWRSSLPGQACKRLDQLVNDYQIFSFYG